MKKLINLLAGLMLGLSASVVAAAPVYTASAPASVMENAVSAPVTLTKPVKASSYSKITVSTGSTADTAKPGVDYVAINQTLTIANSTLKTSIPLKLINNQLFVGPRTVTVKFVPVRNASVSPLTLVITINEDDPPPPATKICPDGSVILATSTCPAPPPTVTWTQCAQEGETCYVVGTANVRYGANGTWLTKVVTGSILCSWTIWTDPLWGVNKTCQTDGTVGTAPPPTAQWVAAPLKDGGYARCKTVGGCHSWTAPCPLGTETYPPTCTSPNIVAQQGAVMMYAWNGAGDYHVTPPNPLRVIGAFWPIGQYKTATPYVGFEGWADEWEGVAPASLSVGGFAELRNGPSLIVRLLATGITNDADLAHRQHWWLTQYQQDASGNFPADNPYWKSHTGYLFDDDLIPVTFAATP